MATTVMLRFQDNYTGGLRGGRYPRGRNERSREKRKTGMWGINGEGQGILSHKLLDNALLSYIICG